MLINLSLVTSWHRTSTSSVSIGDVVVVSRIMGSFILFSLYRQRTHYYLMHKYITHFLLKKKKERKKLYHLLQLLQTFFFFSPFFLLSVAFPHFDSHAFLIPGRETGRCSEREEMVSNKMAVGLSVF